MKGSEMERQRAENAAAWGPIDGLDDGGGKPADGSGNAVADLEALRAEVERSAELKAEVEQGDGFYWMERARAAEAMLRRVSPWVEAASVAIGNVADALKGGESDG